MFASFYRCPDCGSSSAYRSRRRSIVEKYLLPLLLLRPLRCSNCFRRRLGFVLIPAHKRLTRAEFPQRAA